MKIDKLLVLFLLTLSSVVFAQKDSIKRVKHSLNGYVKYLATTTNQPLYNTVLTDNLIHNRLNYQAEYKSKQRLNISARNRFFWGEVVKITPDYGDLIQGDDNLSYNWVNDSAVVFNTTIDRLNIELVYDKIEIILGRQRVNWGTALVWNPNDIFNSYSFFDFDYEERPGTDAGLIRYYKSYTSKVEFVYEVARTFEESSMAFLYQTNKWNYDIQGFVGYQREALVTGGGWTGNLKGAGFRGEATYFYENGGDIEHQLVATVDLDYTFSSTIYLHTSYLYNSIGINSATGNYQGFYLNRDLGARTLSPSRHTMFAEVSYQFSPPVRGSLFGMVNPKDGSFFIGPMVAWNVVENFDVLLNAQIFSHEPNTAFGGYGQSYYLRFKYSF